MSGSSPPSENESGVAFTIPISSGAPPSVEPPAAGAQDARRRAHSHQALGRGLVAERRGLGGAARGVPAQLLAQRGGDALGACSPGAHSARAPVSPSRVRRSSTSPTVPRLLAPRGVDRLGEQVRAARGAPAARARRALGREREHVARGVAVAAGELRVGVLRHALDPRQRGGVDRHAERDLVRPAGRVAASRSTIRSTASFAIRRQVVSLPPVIVTIPLDVSYSSALREMSTDFFGSPVEISGRTPANAPATSPGPEPVPKNSFTAVEQVGDVLAGGLHVLDVALEVVVRRPDQRAAEPRQHEDRAPAAGRRDRAGARPAARSDGSTMCVPRLGRMTGTSASSCSSSGRSRSAQTPVALTTFAARTSSSPPPDRVAHHARRRRVERDRLDPVRRHRAEALGLGEHGEHEPHVVGLAVVEQVAARRARARRARAAARHLARRRSSGGAPGSSPRARRRVARAPAPRAADPVDRHHVVHVQPDPEQPVGPRAVERGDDQRQRPDEVRRQGGEQLALEQRLADQPEVEVCR